MGDTPVKPPMQVQLDIYKEKDPDEEIETLEE
jgi:hypothetical protein